MQDPSLCRFYSPDWLGDLLVSRIGGDAHPASAVDLGSGPGALADAAERRWDLASITTIDLDGGLKDAAAANGRSGRRRHVVADVLTTDLIKKIGIEASCFDAAVSNPPYRQVPRRAQLDALLERAGLPIPAASKSLPADILFLAQAIHLVRTGGLIAFIVPDSTISGSDTLKFREAMLRQHRIVEVLQLPRGTFRGTDALAFLMVVERDGRPTAIRLAEVLPGGLLGSKVQVEPDEVLGRLDYQFHLDRTTPCGSASLEELGVSLTRGRASSIEVATLPGTIFHTGDFPETPGAPVHLGRFQQAAIRDVDPSWATTGDILLARVDRRLERKIAVVEEGSAPISDCVLRLRAPSQHVERILAGLTGEAGRRQLEALSRGTGAKHISASTLLGLRV